MNALLTDSPKRRLLREPAEAHSVEIRFSKRFDQADDDCDCSIEAIHARAEAMTPLLDEILSTRPAIHWGINE
jgi:hypothetical protein